MTRKHALPALLLAAAMLFCLFFSIASRADENSPTLYVNDEVWYKTGLYPLRVYNSVYVPISIFEQIAGITVTFYDNNTAMIYRDENSFISFDFNRSVAMSQKNDRFYLQTYLENNERYVPLLTVCDTLGLERETYRSEIDGSVSVRICDGSQQKTFVELIQRYNPDAVSVATTPPVTETTVFLDPVENAIFLGIDGFGAGERMEALLDLLDEYGVKAAFFITPEELERYPDLVLSVIAGGHSLGFLVELEGALETLSAANAALMQRYKITTRLIRITDHPISAADDNRLAVAGYSRWGSSIDLGRTESEVRAALVTFRQSLGLEGHIVLRAVPDGYNTVGYLREFFKSAQGKRIFLPITTAYISPAA